MQTRNRQVLIAEDLPVSMFFRYVYEGSYIVYMSGLLLCHADAKLSASHSL